MCKADTSPRAGIQRMAVCKQLPTECVHACVSGVGVRHKYIKYTAEGNNFIKETKAKWNRNTVKDVINSH